MSATGPGSCRTGSAGTGSYLAADVDGFQQINVLLGQDQGDFILEQLAERLGISRKTLWDRRRRFGIPREKSRGR